MKRIVVNKAYCTRARDWSWYQYDAHGEITGSGGITTRALTRRGWERALRAELWASVLGDDAVAGSEITISPYEDGSGDVTWTAGGGQQARRAGR